MDGPRFDVWTKQLLASPGGRRACSRVAPWGAVGPARVGCDGRRLRRPRQGVQRGRWLLLRFPRAMREVCEAREVDRQVPLPLPGWGGALWRQAMLWGGVGMGGREVHAARRCLRSALYRGPSLPGERVVRVPAGESGGGGLWDRGGPLPRMLPRGKPRDRAVLRPRPREYLPLPGRQVRLRRGLQDVLQGRALPRTARESQLRLPERRLRLRDRVQ